MKLSFKNLKHSFKTFNSQSQIASLLCNFKFNYGQQQLKINISNILQQLYGTANASNVFLLVGNEGLGKTIIARDIFCPALHKIGKTKVTSFLKVNAQNCNNDAGIITTINPNKNGFVNFYNIQCIACLNYVLQITQQSAYKHTGFSISISTNLYYQFITSVAVSTNSYNTLFFQPYTTQQMAQILVENLVGCHKLQMDINQLSAYEKLVEKVKDKCQQLSINFEYITTLNFFFNKCFIKAALYLHATRLDNRLVMLSLKNFENYSRK